MHRKTFGVLLMGAVLLTLPEQSTAAYILKLKNGRQLTTTAYWKEGKTVVFEVEGGGTARVQDDTVLSIQQTTDEQAPEPAQAPTRRQGKGNPTAVEQPQGEKKEVDVEAYRRKKEELKQELDASVAQRSEAAGANDSEAKAKTRLEIVERAQKIFALEDALKKKNGGVLPEGWQ